VYPTEGVRPGTKPEEDNSGSCKSNHNDVLLPMYNLSTFRYTIYRLSVHKGNDSSDVNSEGGNRSLLASYQNGPDRRRSVAASHRERATRARAGRHF